MKKATVRRFADDPKSILKAAQRDRVLVTRNGKPVALIVGLENKDAEDLRYMASREFWEMIRERRARPTVRWEDVKADLLRDD